MPLPANEADVARVLWRAAQEFESEQAVALGEGLPEGLRDAVGRTTEPESAELTFVEVQSVSPSGAATSVLAPTPIRGRVIGLCAAGLDELDELIQVQEDAAFSITRLICPFAVFDFGANGLVVREIQHGLTAADLQQKLDAPLWAGPDLKELGTH